MKDFFRFLREVMGNPRQVDNLLKAQPRYIRSAFRGTLCFMVVVIFGVLPRVFGWDLTSAGMVEGLGAALQLMLAMIFFVGVLSFILAWNDARRNSN